MKYQIREGESSGGNRTLIQRMGFNDPDHKDSRHDMACKYLILQDNIEKIANVLWKDCILKSKKTISASSFYHELQEDINQLENALITKKFSEYNKYRSYGTDSYLSREEQIPYFIEERKKKMSSIDGEIIPKDMMKRCFSVEIELEKPISSGNYVVGFADIVIIFHRYVNRQASPIIVEVKSAPISINEILRQINFYRKIFYSNDSSKNVSILAHLFNLSKSDADILKKEYVVPLFLGNNFNLWCEEQKSETACNDVEI